MVTVRFLQPKRDGAYVEVLLENLFRSLKGQIKLTTFCFNEAFLVHQRKDFIDNFFHDAVVVSVLNSLLPNWPFNRENIVKIEAQTVPCTVSSMSFFDRIQNERNKIIRGEGNIRQCLDDVIDGFLVSDELRKVRFEFFPKVFL